MKLLKELFKTYIIFLGLFFIGRVVLYSIYFDRLSDISFSESLLTFIYGARLDTIVIAVILIIPTILITISPKIISNFVAKFLKYYLFIWLIFLVYIENATIPFFVQYDVRPNYLFVEYLEYPKEVLSLMLKDYKIALLIAFTMMFLVGRKFLRSDFINFSNAFEVKYIYRFMMLLPLLILLFIGIRSSFGHRPANISDALYSKNRIINEITKNSFFSVGDAWYSNKKNSPKKQIEKYGKMNLEEAYKLTSEVLNIPFDDKKIFYREVKSHFKTEKPKNLVIFLQESMGSQFVEFSGGEKDLTPNMNRLGTENIAFTNLFSNGTRSIRGLAGMSSGILAIPGEGVVKRQKSQSGFFSVANLLKPYGYKSSFVYGGEARFDNMKSWYLGNGFDEVVEQKDFKDPIFVSTWGVSDEDLVIKANEKFKEYSKNGEKFVTVMFSQSNHAPFELPEGKIEFLKNEPKQSVRNAIRYADFAIGKFFELAKKEEYYKNTVFVVVADHNVRVYGDDVVPVNMFHIPAVIVSDGVKAEQYNRLSTQPDVLATALDLIGVDLKYPILGHSIYSDTKTDVSLMQFNDVYGLRKGDVVAVIGPNMKPQTYKYINQKLILIGEDKLLQKQALAIITVLIDMYERGTYKVYDK
ncbi:MAG: LTA synthase family protein [Arcobacteraceae bacterium]|nr:LTA synthase family protein [Arcobacteraceae bacterium]